MAKDDTSGGKDGARAVLDFWFGASGEAHAGKPRKIWFEKDPAFDAEIRARFAGDYGEAKAGTLGHWRESAETCLALILVLDQFPRNLFRDDRRAFATDPAALETAKHALARGYDRAMSPLMRKFFYLPFLHSENLADQEAGVALMESAADTPMGPESVKSAIQHRDIVARFGRFPHRNALLGRESTAEELAFLDEPGSSF